MQLLEPRNKTRNKILQTRARTQNNSQWEERQASSNSRRTIHRWGKQTSRGPVPASKRSKARGEKWVILRHQQSRPRVVNLTLIQNLSQPSISYAGCQVSAHSCKEISGFTCLGDGFWWFWKREAKHKSWNKSVHFYWSSYIYMNKCMCHLNKTNNAETVLLNLFHLCLQKMTNVGNNNNDSHKKIYTWQGLWWVTRK